MNVQLEQGVTLRSQMRRNETDALGRSVGKVRGSLLVDRESPQGDGMPRNTPSRQALGSGVVVAIKDPGSAYSFICSRILFICAPSGFSKQVMILAL